jgi:lysozyme
MTADAPLVSPRLADFVAGWEGFRPTAYRCPAGVWTIGYGSTAGVGPGDVITRAEALDRLMTHMEGDAGAVDRLVITALEPHERDALISLTYNIGRAAFAHSTLLRVLNGGDKAGAAAQMLRWTRSGGALSPGLIKRRAAERRLFLFADYSGAP